MNSRVKDTLRMFLVAVVLLTAAAFGADAHVPSSRLRKKLGESRSLACRSPLRMRKMKTFCSTAKETAEKSLQVLGTATGAEARPMGNAIAARLKAVP